MKPLLSVCVITYNHSKYVRQAIDSVLMQMVNFEWEVIIADDFSTDGTREILLEYQARYPKLIRLLFQERNVGAAENWIQLINTPKAKYIAYLEGDDFWVDPLKLKKQVEYMEKYPMCSFCFGKANVISEENASQVNRTIYQKPPYNILLLNHIIDKHYVHSGSLIFRRDFLHLPQFYKTVISGDILLEVLLAERGFVKYFNDEFSVYREHMGGITKSPRNIQEGKKKLYELFYKLNFHFEFKYDAIIKRKLSAISKSNLISGSGKLKGFDRLKNIVYWYPKYLTNTKFRLRETFYVISILFFPFLIRIYIIIRDKIVSMFQFS